VICYIVCAPFSGAAQSNRNSTKSCAFTLENESEKLMRSGLTRDEASRKARLSLGGVDQVKEECRDARGVSLLETTMQDLRHGMRGLRRNLGLAILRWI
jgi:hypothetical protein